MSDSPPTVTDATDAQGAFEVATPAELYPQIVISYWQMTASDQEDDDLPRPNLVVTP